jgi:hypothetical protein
MSAARWIVPALMMFIVPGQGLAQQAPTGAHYAGRGTDTGFGGSLVSSTGSYSTSIPLDLPAERAGLPVPLQISYGTRGVGAAGLGWDIPFSFIRRDRTFAHRRPAGYAPPQPRERTFISLLGASGELVPQWVTPGLFVPVRSSSLCVKAAPCSWPMMAPAAPIRSRSLRSSVALVCGCSNR